jgi:DNA polymerase sigma|tara:strand:- start:56 stop:241 length:186 start_codon:yes stop_codon:yes gene_type:complete
MTNKYNGQKKLNDTEMNLEKIKINEVKAKVYDIIVEIEILQRTIKEKQIQITELNNIIKKK